MDLYTVATVMLFYGVAKGAKQALRIGGGDTITVPENDPEPSRVMAVVIVEDVDESEEINPSMKSEAVMLPLIENPEVMMPWVEHPKTIMPFVEDHHQLVPLIEVVKAKHYDEDEDTSGESNSDEYSDSDSDNESGESATDSESDTDKESNYYHEDDYLKAKIMKKVAKLNNEKNNPKVLRNRWKSCQKKASKYCRQACVASYKNACQEEKCKKKLKKVLKKECKRNCKEFFIDS